ncbi:N-acetylneuraminate synthase family protein, partial [Thalassospira sp.]|uniref:N-acetylneuraminate synthase family protein n=1 Tax=Thalassospira sp. TaxID=1912094 RepID=UPI00311DCBBB
QSILAAKKSGAHAVKLQTYTADSMTIDCDRDDFKITGGLWDGYTLYQLYTEAHTPYEWHEELFRYAREIGITIFSSPFDETAIDLLQRLDAPAYKVASLELNDHPLIERI